MLTRDLRSRFSDAPWLVSQKNTTYTVTFVVAGAGGIGSRLVPLLLSLGDKIEIIVYDPDIVKEENLISQNFSITQLGHPKVEGVEQFCKSFIPKKNVKDRGSKLITFKSRINESAFRSYLAPNHLTYMISTVDNMETRKRLFTEWDRKVKEKEKDEMLSKRAPMFIDARMRAEQFQIYFVKRTKEDIERYIKTLESDDDIPDEPCTYRNTGHFGWMIASTMIQGITNHLTNLFKQEELYEVPFLVETIGPSFQTQIVY